MQHNVGRFLSTMENHHGSLAYYPLVFLVGLAPWTVFIGMTSWCTIWSMIRTPWTRFRETWSKAADRATGGEASTYRFLAAWLGLYLVFFSAAATKLPNYVLPAAVPCAVLTARFLERWRHGSLSVPAWAMPTSLLCLAAIGVASGIGMAIASGLWPLPLVRGRYIPGLAHWTFLGLVPVATALAAAWLLRRRKRSALLACLVVGAVAFLAPLAAWSSAAFNQVKATRGLVEQAQALQPTRDIRVGCWRLEHLPSLNFYVQRDVIHHKSQAQALAFLRCHVPVFLFLPAEDWETMRHQAPPGWRERGRHPDFYHHTEVVVISNR
jgi:4-amino-4-deoxy-L-arabinose transferase-like glycosyltransferase